MAQRKKAAPAKTKRKKNKEPEEVVIGAGYDNTTEWNARPPKGERQDFSLAMMDAQYSKKGNPMGKMTAVVDSGEFAGSPVDKYYVFGQENQSGEKQLKTLAIATGFRHEGNLPLSRYCSQWTDFDEPLRFSALINYNYNIEQDGAAGWVNNVKEEEYTEHDGPKRIGLELASIKEPQFDEPDIQVEVGEPWDEDEPDEDDDLMDDDLEDEDDTPF